MSRVSTIDSTSSFPFSPWSRLTPCSRPYHHHYSQGVALVPAFGVLYFRLTLVESTRFTQARALQDNPELLAKAANAGHIVPESNSEEFEKEKHLESSSNSIAPLENEAIGLGFGTIGKKPHNEFIEYFSEWRHLKLLIGTALNWFLVDITFYGINLNQSSILAAIGFTSGSTWSKLMKTATGNLIITCAGFLQIGRAHV